MKRLLAVLLALLLLAPAAMAEEPVNISLYTYELEQTAECEVRLHLLLYKTGDACYAMQEIQTVLYDAAGGVVEPAQTEMAVFPLAHIPAGAHYLPVTLVYTLAAPAQVADFSVTGIVGTQEETLPVTMLDVGVPYIAGWHVGGVTLTAWLPMAEGTAAEDYFTVLIAVDAESGYLGNGALEKGMARHVSGEDIIAEVEAVTGVSRELLEERGYVFDAQDYAFFEDIPMPYLLDVPASVIAVAYHETDGWQKETPVVRMADRIDMHEDGSFAIHGCFECTQEGLWQLTELTDVTLIAADGTELPVAEFSFDTPYTVVSKGLFLPYVIQGRVEPGFAAEDFRIGYLVRRVEKEDFRFISGGQLVPSIGADGTITLNATLPEGVADPAVCFVSVMFLDLLNDAYQGAVWTYPGEAWVQDGEIRLPEMTAPEGCTIEAAMVTVYCAAE